MLAAFFVATKYYLFRQLEYTSDLFSFLQMSQSYLWQRPLFFENAFGSDAIRYHNYFLTPLLAPFAIKLGALGLFVVHGLLMALAAFYILSFFGHQKVNRLHAASALLLVLLFGPISFYVFDNVNTGWHLDTLFLPLSIIFTAQLMRGSGWKWLSGLALLLVREEGALILWAISMQYLQARQDIKPSKKIGAFFKQSIFFLVLFLLSLARLWFVQQGLHHLSSVLSESYFEKLFSNPEVLLDLKGSLNIYLLISGSLLLASFYFMSIQSFATLCLILLPLLGTQIIGGLKYSNFTNYGPLWAPRLAGTLAIIGAAMFIDLKFKKIRFQFSGKSTVAFLIFTFLSIFAQYLVLNTQLNYPLEKRIAYSDFDRKVNRYYKEKLTEHEISFLKNLSAELPAYTSIGLNQHLFSFFEKHEIVWMDRYGNAWQMPKIVICCQSFYADADECRYIAQGPYFSNLKYAEMGNLSIRYGEEYSTIVNKLLKK